MIDLGCNFLTIDADRLSGIGQYCVRTFGEMVQVLQGRRSIIAYVQEGAEHHFPDALWPYLRPLPRMRGRVHRVLFEQTHFALRLRRDKVNILLNAAFTGPLWGARRNVTVIHDLYFKTVPDLLERFQRRYLEVAVPLNCALSWKIVTDSEAGAKDIARYFPNWVDRTAGVPLAGRFDEAPPQRNHPVTKMLPRPFVLIVASLTSNKNPAVLVDAVSRLRAQGHVLDIVHVGSDLRGLLRSKVIELGAESWVRSLGAIDDDALIAIYRSALCLALPSLYEGFGLPLLEAQQLGVPVVSSNRSCLPEVGGEGALYFDPESPAELSEQLHRLLREPALPSLLIARGLENASRFSWRRTAEDTLRHLELI